MKRTCTILLAVMMILSCSFTTAFATDASTARASVTLAKYAAALSKGSTLGSIKITYSVSSNMPASEIGVSNIDIYTSNNVRVASITGTTSNGLLTSSNIHMGTYTYTGAPGVSYYAEVTFTATANGVSDSRMVTTSVVKAP